MLLFKRSASLNERIAMLSDLEKAQYKIYLWTDKQFNPGVVNSSLVKTQFFLCFR